MMGLFVVISAVVASRCLLGSAGSLPTPNSRAAAVTAMQQNGLVHLGERRHLLVDDVLLANMSGGLRFETSQPLGITDEPVVSADAAWERGCWISWYNSVLVDPLQPGQLRLYYSLYCTDPMPPSGLPVANSTHVLTALSIATSTDAYNWDVCI